MVGCRIVPRLASVVTIVAAISAMAPAAQATYPGANGDIAYLAQGSDLAIRAVAPDGSEDHRLSIGRRDAVDAEYTPARRPHPPPGSRHVGPHGDPAAGRGAGSGRPVLDRRVAGRWKRSVLRVRSLARRPSLHDQRRWVGSHEDLLRHGRLSRRLGGERPHRGDPGARLRRASRVPHGPGRERPTARGDPSRSPGELHLLRGAHLGARRLEDRLRRPAEHPSVGALGCRSRRLRSPKAHDDQTPARVRPVVGT